MSVEEDPFYFSVNKDVVDKRPYQKYFIKLTFHEKSLYPKEAKIDLSILRKFIQETFLSKLSAYIKKEINNAGENSNFDEVIYCYYELI